MRPRRRPRRLPRPRLQRLPKLGQRSLLRDERAAASERRRGVCGSLQADYPQGRAGPSQGYGERTAEGETAAAAGGREEEEEAEAEAGGLYNSVNEKGRSQAKPSEAFGFGFRAGCWWSISLLGT